KTLVKSYCCENFQTERLTTTPITFANTTGLGAYTNVVLTFQVASLSDVGLAIGPGNDAGENMKIEISLDGGASWSTTFTYAVAIGTTNFLFPFSNTNTNLAYN